MQRTAVRAVPFALIAAAAVLAGCDPIFGPEDDPDSVEITASRYTIEMLGDTVLLDAEVRTEGGDLLPDANVSWESRTPSVAMIDGQGLLTARSNGTVWIVARSGAAVDSVSFTIASPITCAAVGDLAVTDSVSGDLEEDDCQIAGRYVDAWLLQVEEREQISIQLLSDEFDAFLFLLTAEGDQVAFNDDGGGGFDSRITVTPGAGSYYVYATTYGPGATGSYDLRVIRGVPPSPCPATAILALPDTVTGAVAADGCVYSGFYVDVWRLDIERDTTVTFQVDSDDFEPVVIVGDTLGNFRYSSGYGPGTSAWMEVDLAAGSHDVWVGPETQPGVGGSYTLSLLPGSVLLRCDPAGSIQPTQVVASELTPDDCFAFVGAGEAWTLDLADTTEVALRMASDDFVPLILLSDSTGEIVDLYFEAASPVLAEVELLPGSYRVWALANGGEFGAYDLAASIAGQMPDCEPAGAVAVGDTVDSALATTDCLRPNDAYADVWTLQLDRAASVTVTLDSDKFDAYLIVADSTGFRIARDDDSGGNRNAALSLDLEAGRYQLWATSFQPDVIGAYQLGVVRSAAASPVLAAPTDATKSPRVEPADWPLQLRAEWATPPWEFAAPASAGGATKAGDPPPWPDAGGGTM